MHARFPVWLLGATLACGGPGDEEVEAEAEAEAEGESCEPGPLDLTGRFGVLSTLRVHIDTPFEGVVENTTGHILLLADLDQQGTAVQVRTRLCDIEIPPLEVAGNDPMAFAPGPDLIASFEEKTGAATLSGAATCADFLGEPIEQAGGLTDPSGELPRAACADSPPAACRCGDGAPDGCTATTETDCICDQEWDGRAGATVLVTNLLGFDHDGEADEFYVGLRASLRLRGRALSSDRVEGEVETLAGRSLIEQAVVGCRIDGEDCAPGTINAVAGLNPVIDTQPDNPSTFLALRVAGDVDCAALVARRDQLFR